MGSEESLRKRGSIACRMDDRASRVRRRTRERTAAPLLFRGCRRTLSEPQLCEMSEEDHAA